MDKSEIDNKNNNAGNFAITPDKIVPKFCTNINIGLLNTKNLVLTLVYSEGENPSAVIDRVVIDFEHAKSLRSVLNRLIEEGENAPI